MKKIVNIILNLLIVISTLIITINGFNNGAGAGQIGNDMIGFGYFKPFTMDSNILNAIISLIVIISLLKNKKPSKKLNVLHLVGVVNVSLTFLVVVLFLAPRIILEGGNSIGLFRGDMFFFHLLNPILSIISFLFLTDGNKLSKKDSLYPLIPLIIYGTIYIVCTKIINVWDDFYRIMPNFISIFISVGLLILINYFSSRIYIKIFNKNK